MPTQLADAPPQRTTSGAPGWHRAHLVESAAAALALVAWGITLTHATGGQAPYTMTLAVLATLPLVVASDVARRVPPWAVTAALLPGTIAFGLNLVSATGWTGLGAAASWWCAGLLGLGLTAFARTARRRRLVAGAVVLVGAEQMFQAWFPWWGSGDPHALLVGTFFWHNPFAAFQAATSLVGLAVAMRGRGPVRSLALVLTPWLAAGVWLSGSRAGLALWLVAVVALAGFAARTWGQAAVVGGQAVASFAVAWVLASPLLMSGAGAAGVAAAGRTEGAEGNFLIRLDYWRAAASLATHHLLVGAGFGSFAGAGAPYMPVDKPASSLVHNGWLQVLVDGGLVWAVPVVAVTGWLAARAVRRLVTARHAGAEPAGVGAAVGVLLLLAHAMFDIDWSYPALLGLYAVLAALLPWRLRPVGDRERGRAGGLALIACLVALTLLAAGAALVDGAQRVAQRPDVAWQRIAADVLPARVLAAQLPYQPADVKLLQDAAGQSSNAVRRALARTAAAAAADPVLAQQRALALVRLGDVAGGLATSAAAYPDQPRPKTVIARAEVLVAAGDLRGAVRLVATALTAARAGGSPSSPDLAEWLTQHPIPAEASTQGGESTSAGTSTNGEATR